MNDVGKFASKGVSIEAPFFARSCQCGPAAELAVIDVASCAWGGLVFAPELCPSSNPTPSMRLNHSPAASGHAADP